MAEPSSPSSQSWKSARGSFRDASCALLVLALLLWDGSAFAGSPEQVADWPGISPTMEQSLETLLVTGGRCYSNAECGGGVCRSGRCTTAGGLCYSDAECAGGTCRSGACTSAGGRCYSNSECPGGACRSGNCTTAGGRCYSDRECAGGRCRSGQCTTAGGRCYANSECGGGVCRSGKCTAAVSAAAANARRRVAAVTPTRSAPTGAAGRDSAPRSEAINHPDP